MSAKDVIIALDFPTREETLSFLDQFPAGEKPFVKIGMELFYAEGPQVVRDIKARGHKIFLDLKLHDIPNTVKRAMAVLSRLDVDMVNLHAAGTSEMMRAALEGLTRPDGTRPLLIGRDGALLRQERRRQRPGRRGLLSSGGGSGQGALRRGLPDRHPRHPVRGQCRRRPEADHDSGEGGQVWLRLHRGGPSHHPGGGPGVRLSESGQGLLGLSGTGARLHEI